jgi:hypothetical protein
MLQIIIWMKNLINYPEVRNVGSWLKERSELNERRLMLIDCLKLHIEYKARRNSTKTDFSHEEA